MSLSRASILALQRHFLGALSAPARVWLEPLAGAPIVVAGPAVRTERGACTIDLGAAEPGVVQRQLVTVMSIQRADVRPGDGPEWLARRWRGTDRDTVTLESPEDRAILELSTRGSTEGTLHGVLRLEAERSTATELTVRTVVRRTHPLARIDFNGSPVPRAFDLGRGNHPYVLSIANEASLPLVVSFSDLPSFLAFEVDGHRRSGPAAGRFFERKAPFTATIRATGAGQHEGSLLMQTNDRRPELQNVTLQFRAELDAPPAPVHVEPRTAAAKQRRRLLVRPELLGAVAALLLLLAFAFVIRGLS